jgi:hypothetical protein
MKKVAEIKNLDKEVFKSKLDICSPFFSFEYRIYFGLNL